METGYFFVCDLLGFGQIIKNSTEPQRQARTDAWLGLVEDSAKAENVQIQLVSDTVFARADNSDDGIAGLVAFARRLLNLGVPQSLPVRGAITYGEFEWGRFTHGTAVVDAHELESNQNWVGITCAKNLPRLPQLWGFERVICYIPPMKSGIGSYRGVIDWEIPGAGKLFEYLTSGGLALKGESLRWDLLQKYDNTVAFSIYKRLTKLGNYDPSLSHNQTGLHFIERRLRELEGGKH